MSELGLDERGVLVSCPRCDTRNRLPYERLGQPARCARCRTELRPPHAPLEVPDAGAFAALTRRSALPVLVDFWAEWCGPCKMMAPELAKAAQAGAGTWVAAKLNTEELPEVAQQFGISAIPLLVLFNGGREVAREAGARPTVAITQFVQQHV